MPEKFLILDSNSILYRAYFALPKLTTKKGEVVNGIYGFLLVLFKLIKEIKPKYIGACFDFPAPTFRHKEFKEYKAKRPKMPDDLILQIPRLKEILEAFSIPIFEKKNFEADDLIGTLVNFSPKEIEKIIVTGDFDTLQLVDRNVKVYFLQRGVKEAQIFDREKVKEKFEGLKPEQIPDFKALVGDPSDNILGIEGIGPKTARELLLKYKSIENILNNIERDPKIKENLKKKILNNKEKLLLNLKLAKIEKNIPLKVEFEKLKFGNYNEEKVKKVLEKFEFKSLIKRLEDLKSESKNLKLFK
jgi:DNA polymerase-1